MTSGPVFRGAGLGRSTSSAVGTGLAALVVVAFFGSVCWDLAVRGGASISWEFLVSAPRDAGRAGGIGPIIISTLGVVGVCLAATVPAGIVTAVHLAEFSSRDDRLGRWTRRSLDTLAAVPSIVFGLFGNAFFCEALGMGSSLLAGGLTLACMVLPFFIRTVEIGLRSVPRSQREAAHSLGLRPVAVVLRVVLPQARPAVLAGLILGLGRALSETAALVFTSGYSTRLPRSLWESGRTLSVHIYDLAGNVAGGEPAACATALVLVLLLFALNGITRLFLAAFERRLSR
ncbi:MAG: phosphate ABC transporter permease PstA [Planctomycetes bacterium]|nr:phosphate ABC transporter permease PstA [Planctomycetota bacterium]